MAKERYWRMANRKRKRKGKKWKKSEKSKRGRERKTRVWFEVRKFESLKVGRWSSNGDQITLIAVCNHEICLHSRFVCQ